MPSNTLEHDIFFNEAYSVIASHHQLQQDYNKLLESIVEWNTMLMKSSFNIIIRSIN